MKTVRLEKEISLADFGGIPFIADINQDGKQEFLILQSPGLFRAEIHGGSQNMGWNHFCLTALDYEGKLLWQKGIPWTGESPYVTHGAERSLCVCDFNGDDKLEIYVIDGENVLGLNPDNGETISEFALPYDNFTNLLYYPSHDNSNKRRLLASPSNDAYDGHEHGGPSLIFDNQGNVVFERDIFGFGHDPKCLDINGDGVNEWLVGYEALDCQLEKIWSFQPCDEADYDGLEMHVDYLDVLYNNVGQPELIAFAASTFLYVIDVNGNLKWQKELIHPQQVIFGQFGRQGEGCLFVLNKRASLQMFDLEGNELWTIWPEENWPYGKPEGLENKFHLFDPCVKLPGLGECNSDIICYLEGGWPYGINGKGDIAVEFECPESSKQPPVPPYRRPDDYGWGYIGKTYQEDGRYKLIISDRNHLWLYDVTDA